MSHPSNNLISNDTFSAAIVEAEKYNRWIVDFYRDFIHGDVLEIGVGHGSFIDYMPSGISTYTGFDIDPKLIEWAQKRNPQGTYVCGDLSADDVIEHLHHKKFDAILCINVLEHIPNHGAALRNMLNALKPGRSILLFVPAFMDLYQDMDRLAGHERRYTIHTLRQLCIEHQAQIARWHYFNCVGGLGWWINKFRTHTNLNSSNINQQIRFFERYLLPISKTLQKLTCKIFGQSLYAVIQRSPS